MIPRQSVIAANINYHRTLCGLKQEDIVKALGISRPTYNRKCSKEEFTVADLRIIARVLHTQINELLKGV